jgi:amino acid transporter
VLQQLVCLLRVSNTHKRLAIGTGLFVGSGVTLSLVGPANLFMAFIVMSGVVWCVMNSLAEMTTYLPIPGASVPAYVNRFFEPSMAFAAGWNYWYAYAMLVAAEYVFWISYAHGLHSRK